MVKLVPGLIAAAAVAALTVLLLGGRFAHLTPRVPGQDNAADLAPDVVARGTLTPGPGQCDTTITEAWPRFRGPKLDGIALLAARPAPTLHDGARLARNWPADGPKTLWSIPVGEGYAGPAVLDGRVYLMDYDAQNRGDCLRCLSLTDGREIWRYFYKLKVKRYHGMSRTVPAVTRKYVVAMGPKCHVTCLDAVTGEFKWMIDLVREYGATVPEWYTGQCPLIDGERVILGVGGPDHLLLAVDLETGKPLENWKAPNPLGWKMTHSSVMPMEVDGRRLYVYCGSGGVAGVAADSGEILWQTTEWRISIATVPSPLIVGDGRVFLSGGYDAGSMMLRIAKEGDRLAATPLFRLDSRTFGSTQQTPILYRGHVFGMRPNGQFVCLDLSGKVVWESGPNNTFGDGMGPYLIADGLIYVMNDKGALTLLEASPEGFKRLAGPAQPLTSHDSWGPMALVGHRLLVRDFTTLACLEVGP